MQCSVVHVGEKSSGFTGWVAAIYFPMLATHVLLAFATLPLVIMLVVVVAPEMVVSGSRS